MTTIPTRLLLLLAACAPTMQDRPSPPPITLSAGALVPGAVTTLTVTGATPGRAVYFGRANQVGAGPCPPLLGGACLDLVSPALLGTVTADATGEATLQVPVPASAPVGSTLYLQAAQGDPSPSLSSSVQVSVASDATLITIDRSAVPAVSFPTVTLRVATTSSSAVFLDPAGNVLPSRAEGSDLIVSTEADAVNVELPPGEQVLSVSVSPLYDAQRWAWSHGFDDNMGLAASIAEFENAGLRATLFQIANIVDDVRQEGWITDAPEVHRLMELGWSLGNHSWDHGCYGGFDYRGSIVAGQMRLEEVIAASPRPDYVLTSFAAPCFDATYHPFVLDVRDDGSTALLFNESGNDYRRVADQSFDFDTPIGRDTRVEWDTQGVLDELDSVANEGTSSRPIWYNTLAHGNHEASLSTIIDHVVAMDGGWVAPSDEIYAYLLHARHTLVQVQ